MTTYGQDSFTLFLRVQSAQNLSTRASAAFCTMLVWSNASKDGPAKSTPQPKCTRLKPIRANHPVEWDEELQMDVTDPATEVLTIRVKDHRDILLASCNVYLTHLRQGQALAQKFELHPTGQNFLKLLHFDKPPPKLCSDPSDQPSLYSDPDQQNSPYSAEFQALVELELKKREARVNQSPLPSNIAAMVDIQNKTREDAQLLLLHQLQKQQQTLNGLLQAQMQARPPAPYPQLYNHHHYCQQQQQQRPNFHEMMGTAANVSTIAANLQQLNGGDNSGIGTGAVGTVVSIGLGALGLGPLGAFFGS